MMNKKIDYWLCKQSPRNSFCEDKKIDTLRILLKATEYDKMILKLRVLLSERYNHNLSLLATEVMDDLLSSDKKINKSFIAKVNSKIQTALGSNLYKELEDDIKEQTEGVYRYSRKRLKLDEGVKIGGALDMGDIRAIGHLTKSNHAWIKGHSLKSKIADDITKVLVGCRENKLTRSQTAMFMERKFGSLVPSDISKKYGEDRYWDGFVRAHATRTRTFSDIETYKQAGYTEYKIYSRLSERTCDICRSMHGTVHKISDCVKRMEDYYTASNNGSISGMKKAFPWLVSEVAPNEAHIGGLLPSFHFRCECRVEVYRAENTAHPAVKTGKRVNVADSGKNCYYLDRGKGGSDSNRRRDKIAYTTLDKTGKEWVVTDKSIEHCKDAIKNGRHLKNGKIDLYGYKNIPGVIRDPAFMVRKVNGDVDFMGKNGYIVVMRDNAVWTSFYVDNGKNLKEILNNTKKAYKKNGDTIYE